MKSKVLGIEMEVSIQHVGLINNDGWLCDKWDVAIGPSGHNRVMYHTGIGHRKYNPTQRKFGEIAKPDIYGVPSGDPLTSKPLRNAAAQIAWIEARTKPVPPKLDDILYNLVVDSSALDMPFTDWCAEYGYSDDSIKAQSSYKACQENGFIMKRICDLEAAREKFQEY